MPGRHPVIAVMYVSDDLTNEQTADLIIGLEDLRSTSVFVFSPEEFGRSIGEWGSFE